MRMRNSLRLAAAVLSVTAFATACGSDSDKKSDAKADNAAATGASTPGAAAPAKPELPVTVDSVGGGKVTVKDVSRIIPLNGDVAEIVFALGLADNVAAVDSSGGILPEAKGKPQIGYQRSLNAEGIVALRPSVIVATPDAGPKTVIDQLQATGTPVVIIPKGDKLADAAVRIEAVAKALGVPAKGKEIADKTNTEIAAAKLKAEKSTGKPRVAFLYMRGSEIPPQLGGRGSRGDIMIEAANAVDAGVEAGVNGFKPLTPEAAVTAKPDFILAFTKGVESVGGPEGVFKLPGLAQTPAGANKKLVIMDDSELGNLGPRTGQALDKLVTALHG
ncbi:heme/hemin ABC transporter substrate-binding protein [Yinghuangia soli]|uniref:ABC transporter substrate-binding protein n=1 Tax=Yinghuangia soli TaxID=2908204 RepID=A0AA41PTL1_9ACTN|nr:ABC transporter substrate-binding protein [Yinghuangia soli]MCF2525640.1 ABC transporter substrate-binding protein [Yinghuangia soli]